MANSTLIRAKSTLLGLLGGVRLEVCVGYPIPPVLDRNHRKEEQAKEQGWKQSACIKVFPEPVFPRGRGQSSVHIAEQQLAVFMFPDAP